MTCCQPPSTMIDLLAALYDESRKVWAATGRTLKVDAREARPPWQIPAQGLLQAPQWSGSRASLMLVWKAEPVSTLEAVAYGEGIPLPAHLTPEQKLELLRQQLTRSLDCARKAVAEEAEAARKARRQELALKRMGLK